MSNSRLEILLTALINGETVDFTPRSRAEQYLKNCLEKCGCDGLPTPASRLDALLYGLSDEMSQGGGSAGPMYLHILYGKGTIEFYDNTTIIVAYVDTNPTSDEFYFFYDEGTGGELKGKTMVYVSADGSGSLITSKCVGMGRNDYQSVDLENGSFLCVNGQTFNCCIIPIQ